jgi:hypothetical protein
MANGLVQAIFDAKKGLDDEYPHHPNIPTFDIERRHAFYGKIDKDSDIVFWDTNFKRQLESVDGNSAFAMDFVADAFASLKINYRKAIQSISRDSVYYTSLRAHRSAFGNGLDMSYKKYMAIIYKNFVDFYLAKDRRYEKVTNYREFVKEFVRYTLKTIKNYPITTSGFISSIHCPPYVSGLMVEVAQRDHGIENNKNIIQYLQDPQYNFWIKQAQKFGFMVDKNAPWRLVFNLGSGYQLAQQDPENLKGAQLFMSNYGLSYDDVFDYRFEKAYKYDLLLLKNIMETMYAAFYRQFSTYDKEEFQIDKSGRCNRVRVSHTRENREMPYEFTGYIDEDDEYWIRVLMKLRFAETEFPHTAHDFHHYADLATQKKRLFGIEPALRYINGLTKGFFVTKFIIKGSSWHGITEKEYDQRLKQALAKAEGPDSSQYTLTGTKNNTR